MVQEERRRYLIQELLSEQPRYRDMEIPDKEQEQRQFLRSLMNIRPPRPIGDEFLKVQGLFAAIHCRFPFSIIVLCFGVAISPH